MRTSWVVGLAVLSTFAARAGVPDPWPDGRRPPFVALPTEQRDDPRALLLGAGSFLGVPEARARVAAALPTALRGPVPELGGWLIVQFRADSPPARRVELLEQHGALVADPLPINARLARVPAAEVAALAREPEVTFVDRFHPAYKLSPILGRERGDAWTVDLRLAPDADPAVVGEAARALGATVIVAVAGQVRVELADGAAAVALAQRDDVLFVEDAPFAHTWNNNARWVLQSDIPGNDSIHAHGVRGSGQVVALMDTGVDTRHCCFSGTGKIKDNRAWGGGVLGADCSTDHGTHTSGTAVCSNGGDHDGLAPGAQLIMQDIGKGGTDCFFGAVHPPSPLSNAWSDAYSKGSRVHSNSWGGGSNSYSGDAQSMDDFMWTHQDFLLVFAAGNSGPGSGSLGGYSNAKNSITVGATGNGTANENLAYFSSRGPAADGRILPDLTAPGDGVESAHNATSVSCGWITESGTSMATPGIAGTAALVRNYFGSGYYPSGAAKAADGFAPTAALVKATLLASTRNMTGSGTNGDRPNSDQGFGRVTLDDALWFTGDPASQRLVILDDRNASTGFSTPGATDSFTLQLKQAGPVKVVLTWTDAAGSPAAARELVNDLDLGVTTPDGQTFTGNQGFAGGWTVVPSAQFDRLNNKEAVFLQNVVPGTLTVKVTAASLGSTSGHPQDYALVVTATANPFCTAAPPVGVGNTLTMSRAGSDVNAGWADRTADHYVVYRGDTPGFYGAGVPPYRDNVKDANPSKPGIQWTDGGAAADGIAHYYLVGSSNACGDITM